MTAHNGRVQVELTSEEIVGKTLGDLQREYPDQLIRVTKVNDHAFFHTLELRPGRLNVAVEGVQELEPEIVTLPADGDEPEVKIPVRKFGDYSEGRIVSFRYEW